MYKRRINIIIRVFLYFLLVSACFLNINKGFDLSDTGYILNSYVFAHSSPDSINFSIIGTSLLGNVLTNIFNFFSIPSYIGFKLITSIMFFILSILVIKVLRNYITNVNLLILSEIIAVFLAKGHIQTLMYNNLSAFILTISALLLITGLIENKDYLIFISGILLGFNFFTRISNIVQILFVITIIYYKRKIVTKEIIYYILGCFISSVLVLIIISILYGLEDLSQMLSVYLSESVSSNDSHSVLDSVRINLMQGLIGLFWLILLYGIYYLISKKYSKINNYQYYCIALMLPILFVILKYTSLLRLYFIDKFYLYFYSLHLPFSILIAFFCILTLYYCFIKKEKNEKIALILLAGFIELITLPMGSNQGFILLYSCFFVQLPVLLYILFNDKKCIVNVFIISYFLSMLIMRNSTYLYRDTFVETNYSFTTIPKLKYVKTSKERVNSIESLYNYFEKNNYEDMKLITYGSIPLLSYLLDIPPFFNDYNGWIEMSQCTLENMKLQLTNRKKDPIIIISKTDVNNNVWPTKETRDNMESIKKEDPKYHLITNFIKDNKYELKFQNEDFLVYANK